MTTDQYLEAISRGHVPRDDDQRELRHILHMAREGLVTFEDGRPVLTDKGWATLEATP